MEGRRCFLGDSDEGEGQRPAWELHCKMEEVMEASIWLMGDRGWELGVEVWGLAMETAVLARVRTRGARLYLL